MVRLASQKIHQRQLNTLKKSVAKPVRDSYFGFCHSKMLTCLTHAHTFVATKEGNTSINKTIINYKKHLP